MKLNKFSIWFIDLTKTQNKFSILFQINSEPRKTYKRTYRATEPRKNQSPEGKRDSSCRDNKFGKVCSRVLIFTDLFV